MARGPYTLAMNVYLADFCSWIVVYLANLVGVQILANPNDVHSVYRTVNECPGHSLYCHLNASHLAEEKKNIFIKRNNCSEKGNILSIRSTFRGVLVRYCLFWMYDGDMAGDDDDESDLRCFDLRTYDVVDDMSDAVLVMSLAS